jgi:hypothetical protein
VSTRFPLQFHGGEKLCSGHVTLLELSPSRMKNLNTCLNDRV